MKIGMPTYKRKRFVSNSNRFAKRGALYRSSSKRRSRLVKLIKRVSLKRCEPKFVNKNFAKTELYHNAMNCFLLMNGTSCMPSQGVGDEGRVGDQIWSTGFKLKLLIGQKGDRPNVNFRYFVVKVPKGSSTTYSSWFDVNTGNVMLDDPNTDFLKVLNRGTWRPNEAGLTATGDDEYTFVKRLWIPYRRLIKFGPGNAVSTHNDDDIYFLLMAYDAYGTAATDNIAYVSVGQTFYYRDP